MVLMNQNHLNFVVILLKFEAIFYLFGHLNGIKKFDQIVVKYASNCNRITSIFSINKYNIEIYLFDSSLAQKVLIY